jgi:hypothetical protein
VDELLQVEQGMSAACASACSLSSVLVPYARAEETLRELAGIEVDDNRLQRVVLASSARAAPWMGQTAEDLKGEDALPPADGTAYVMVDGGRIRLREEGENPWREPCVGIVLWEDANGEWVRYGSSDPRDKEPVLSWLDSWMRTLRRRGVEVVIIGDGAEWIWQWGLKYDWAVQILDYYHLKENVWKAARALHGEGTVEASDWVDEIMSRLWCGWVDSTVARLRRMKPRGWGREQKSKALETLANYMENNDYLIKYAHHRKAGRRIGSGAVESFCKQLFTMRMKGPGMFWSDKGARAVLHLRTVHLTGHWEDMWVPTRLRA